MSKKLKGGIIGAGKTSFIGYVHMSAASLDQKAEIVAGVFSSDPKRSLQRGKELGILESRIYPDYKEMIERECALPTEERIDFIIIATPNSFHFEICISFLEAGFHVFSDKPMAITLEQSHKIKHLAIKKNLVFVLTHGYTGYPMVKQARYLVNTGDLGKIIRIVVEYTQGWLSPLILEPESFKTWHMNPNISGSSCTMMDVGIHALNLVQTITGLVPVEVCADLGSYIPGNPLDDAGAVLMHYNNGAGGVLHASQVSTGEGNALRLRIYGTKAGLSWDQEYPETLEKKNPDGTSTIYRKGSAILCNEAKRATNLPGGHPEGLICAFSNIYRGGFEAIHCLQEKKEICTNGIGGFDFPDANQGIAGLAFIEAIVKNNGSGKKWTSVEYGGE